MRSPLNVSIPNNVVEFVTTANELPQYKIVRSLGIVRGISVRSRNIFASISAVCCSLCGGSNSMFIQLCEDTREEASDIMRKRAGAMGANAIIGMRFDANEIAAGITEVMAYGTAVIVEKC